MTISRTMVRALALAVTVCAAAAPSRAAELRDEQVIAMWPKGAPGSAQFAEPQVTTERSKDPKVMDRAVSNIVEPELLVYRPEKPNGTSVLATPGGAYQRVVIDKEALELARRLNQDGITFFRLVYRLPGLGQAPDAPLMDAQRAMRLIRVNAKDWGLDPARIGLMGFSAGGSLAALEATGFDRKLYEPVDAADAVSARPAFLALGYPVISMDPAITHGISRDELIGKAPSPERVAAYSAERHVTSALPPTFLFAAGDDDVVPIANTLVFYEALRKANVPTELHLFAKGGHGFSLRFAVGLPAAEWPALFVNWTRSIKMMP